MASLSLVSAFTYTKLLLFKETEQKCQDTTYLILQLNCIQKPTTTSNNLMAKKQRFMIWSSISNNLSTKCYNQFCRIREILQPLLLSINKLCFKDLFSSSHIKKIDFITPLLHRILPYSKFN